MTFPVSVASAPSKHVVTRRKALLISCASAALAAGVIAPHKAHAQAFSGGFTNSAEATRAITGATSETITINPNASNGVTINWTPDESGTGTNINFLPNGNVATYVGAAGVTDYTVLNRVVPDGSRAIELNGTVLSRLDGGATGGKIWFYSPNGILVGSTALFDVGGLLLTTADIPSFTSDGTSFSFSSSAAQSGTRVQIDSGAQINALQQNSYVALVAPRVEQHGTVQVNGAAAYVGAEQVSMTMNQGLFDIQVDVGTTDSNGVVHSGATGGPASTGVGDNHRVYMVAVPKNEALTMLLSGNVGFDATTAGVVNGEIILSSGRNVLEADGSLAFSASSPIQSDIWIGSGIYLSHMTALAAGSIFAIADEANLAFSGDLSLESSGSSGEARVHLGAMNGGDVTVGGDLWLASHYSAVLDETVLYANSNGLVIVGGDTTIIAQNDFGGGADPVAAINADNGSILINGSVLLGTAENASGVEVPVDGGGGLINVLASNGGTVTTGALQAFADGVGQSDFFNSGFSGNGTGGNVNIVASSGGTIGVNGALFASADGYGGNVSSDGSNAGDGFGGSVRVAADGGTVSVTGNVALSANGHGGLYDNFEVPPFDAVGGDGIGGWARLEATTSAESVISAGADVIVNANGFGGAGATGGAGFGGGKIYRDAHQGIGGGAGVHALAGSIDITGSITLNTNGIGGDSIGYGGAGGYGEGGVSYLQANGTASVSGGNVFLDANGFGGDGGAGYTDGIEVFIAAGSGGEGRGGLHDGTLSSGGAFVLAEATGAILNLGNLTLTAGGTGGSGGTGAADLVGGRGGDAYGGTAQAGSYDPLPADAVYISDATFGAVNVSAGAQGGAGGEGDQGLGGAADGDGGNATGGGNVDCNDGELCGGAYLVANGDLTTGNVILVANAHGGNGNTGGNALGGEADAISYGINGSVDPTSNVNINGILSVNAAAFGGVGSGGAGGQATGGNGGIYAGPGATLDAGSSNIYVAGTGGAGLTGGAGTGGTAILQARDGAVTLVSMNLNVTADGGAGTALSGGLGQGGAATVNVLEGGAVTTGEFNVFAVGRGGAGGDSSTGGAGGAGHGGDAAINVTDGTMAAGVMQIAVRGVGGVGGDGGDGPGGAGGYGEGGTNSLTVASGSSIAGTSTYTSFANAVGGNAGAGTSGSGNGGSALSGSNTVLIDGTASFGGSGVAGFIATAFSEAGSGATAGNATAGISTIDINGTMTVAGQIQASAQAGQAISGTGAESGGNVQAGTASITVDGSLTAGRMFVATAATAGNGGTTGGNAIGGTSTLTVNGTAQIADSVTITASATGGNGTSGAGGSGGGGLAEMVVGGSITTTGLALLDAGGTGGLGTLGGNGQGGTAGLYAREGGTATLGSAMVRAEGTGGRSTAGNGADGTAGTAEIIATNAGSAITILNATPTVAGYLFGNALVSATGFGGRSDAGVGGTGTGGDATVRAESGTTVTLASGTGINNTIIARGLGGGAAAEGGTGGLGVGGDVLLSADGGTLIAPSVLASSYGQGGSSLAPSLNISGGDGIGGTRNLSATNGGLLRIAANGGGPGGIGGNGSGTGIGGDGIGGTARLDVDNGLVQLTGNTSIFSQTGGGSGATGGDAGGGGAVISVINGGQIVDILGTSSLSVSSGAIGGNGTSQGGSGTATTANLTVDAGSSINVGGTLTAGAIGTGGAGPIGGSGSGGSAQIAVGGSLTTSALSILANGTGGSGVDGGTGTGGSASISSQGTLTATGLTMVYAQGTGGAATTGVGGFGDGGDASVSIDAAATGNFADIEVNGDAFGGNSTSGQGGDAYAGSAEIGSNGTLIAIGDVFVSAEGEGGDGALGGGLGVGGQAALTAQSGGTMTLGTTTNVETEGSGGASSGGSGGDGVGGYAHVAAFAGSSITANDLTVSSSGEGAAGVSGGSGLGGFPFEGSAGSWLSAEGAGATLTLTGLTTVESRGEGGTGTTGAGGDGTGGFADFYTIDGTVTAATVLLDTTGLAGNGATSGYGEGGSAALNAYDGTLTSGAVTLIASGTDAGGEIRINSDTIQTGASIDLASLNATANGGTFAGDVLVDVAGGSTADFGNATLTSNGGLPGTGEDGIELDILGELAAASLQLTSSDDIQINTFGGTITVDGTLEADSLGLITMSDNGFGVPMSASIVDLDGANITFNAIVNADDIAFTLDGDFALAGLPVATNSFSVTAGGNITADGNVVYASSLLLNAGLGITTADIDAAGDLDLTAGGNIATGNLTAGGSIDVDAGGDLSFGNVSADTLDFDAQGTATGLDVVAQTFANGSANGALVVGDITVGPNIPLNDFSVGFESTTSVTVGNVQGADRVGFATDGNLIAGDIAAGSLVIAMVGGDMTVGAITTDLTGNVYLADVSMYYAAGGADDNFDPSQVLAAAPVPTAGSITINGPVTTGTFQAAAGGDLTTGAINADGTIALSATGLLTTGDLVAGTSLAGQSGGNLQIGNAIAGNSINLNSGGNVVTGFLDAPIVGLTIAGDFTTGDLFVDNTLLLTAGGNLTAGNIFAGGDLGLTAGLNLVALDLDAVGNLTLNADGNISAGDLTAGLGIAAGAGGTLTVGDVTSGFVPPSDVIGQAVLATGENVLLSAAGDLTAGTVSSGEGITLSSTGGSITASGLDANTTVDVNAGANFSVAGVTAGTSAVFTAGGLATFNGVVSAPTITVTSGDIDIVEAGSLGAQGVTNLLMLNAVSDGTEVILGGDGTEAAEGQYQLAEDGDIAAAAVVFNAVAAGGGSAPDIRVLDAGIDGSQASDGGVASVTLNTGANVFVQGQVSFTDAAATDTLAINAGETIQIITDTGGIAITGSDGDVSGVLELTAHDIWVADQATLDQIANNPTFAGVEELLAINNGTVNPAGNIQTGDLTVTMLGSSFLVQNSGTAEEPAGLTVGSGGLSIVNNGSEPATVIIYGRHQAADGSIITGDAFFEEVEFAGPGGFSEDSNVNGCEVSGGCGPDEPPFGGGVESILGPVGLMNDPKGLVSGSDEFAGDTGEEATEEEEEEEEDEEESKGGVDAGSSLINTGPVSIDLPIDQPVTSGSDPTGTN